MNRAIILGVAIIGGVIAFRSLSAAPRSKSRSALGSRLLRHMERMMAALPENAPPKLIMSVLPRLREQNEQIIAMLREQNDLLREHLRRAD